MRLILRILTLLLGFSVVLCNESESERSISTSIVGMIKLLDKERLLIEALDNYTNTLQKKVNTLRRAVSELSKESEKALIDPVAYLSNPLNGFSLIRRSYADWIRWLNFIFSEVGEEYIKIIQEYSNDLVTKSDFLEAVAAMHRLQMTYDFSPDDMAKGLLNGVQYDTKLSSLDCFEIGNQLFDQLDFYHTGFWVYSAIQSFQKKDVYDALGFSRTHIIQLYAEVMAKQGRVKDAISVLESAIEENPKNAKLKLRKLDFEWSLKTEKITKINTTKPPPSSYEKGCRGLYSQVISNLHCRYNTTTSPFLKLAPLKMEEIRLDPYIVVYHDVISDNEITELKDLAWHQLKRATVYNEESKRSIVVSKRTSQFSWFNDNLSPATIRINKRISDMTGFDLNGSEMLQVMNYGLGGHYDTHYDFFNVSQTSDIVSMNGDRISTVLFYLSDVDQGGATVFPNIETAVYPRKGTAVMWYNLNNRGEGDRKTLHAACPVIVGSKWVCNKWIRERNQAFRKPCYK